MARNDKKPQRKQDQSKLQPDKISTGYVPDQELSERKKQILTAVIQDYVASCEPVGSKALLSRHQLGVSSATIRNEMSELEDLGYLMQPHTSAGRIPSDKGYRAYVDSILTVDRLSPKDVASYKEALSKNVSEVRGLIELAAGSLAENTELTSLVLTPTYGESELRQVRILQIEPGKAVVVVVLSAGVVRDRVIHVADVLSQEQLAQIASSVEKALAGQKLSSITLLTITDAGQPEGIPESLLNQVLYETYIAIKQAENIDVYMKGSHQLLKQPEFADPMMAHQVLDTISQNGLVAGYLSDLQPDAANRQQDRDLAAFAIRIGQEIALEGLEECSFVTTTYRLGADVRGKIAVVGPKRMEYARIISQMEFVNHVLEDQYQAMNEGLTEPQIIKEVEGRELE
ncbi:MAG: heat-inducible transcriptional repressor HrcA [Eubacteriales bacterium]|nr:heat-inducible transcriptional repressor HrcA [Eubacteriales bacterium]